MIILRSKCYSLRPRWMWTPERRERHDKLAVEASNKYNGSWLKGGFLNSIKGGLVGAGLGGLIGGAKSWLKGQGFWSGALKGAVTGTSYGTFVGGVGKAAQIAEGNSIIRKYS